MHRGVGARWTRSIGIARVCRHGRGQRRRRLRWHGRRLGGWRRCRLGCRTGRHWRWLGCGRHRRGRGRRFRRWRRRWRRRGERRRRGSDSCGGGKRRAIRTHNTVAFVHVAALAAVLLLADVLSETTGALWRARRGVAEAPGGNVGVLEALRHAGQRKLVTAELWLVLEVVELVAGGQVRVARGRNAKKVLDRIDETSENNTARIEYL